MTPDRNELESLSRDELVDRARRAGAKRAEVMTRMELVDEVIRLGTRDPVVRKRARGFLGIARDLLASVVEQGLNLPDAAKMIRGDVTYTPRRPPQPPIATVTLAEIYIAQGHLDKARTILDDVLAREPEHEVAWLLRARLDRQSTPAVAPSVQGAAAGSEAGPGDGAVSTEPPQPAPNQALAPPVAALFRQEGRCRVAWDLRGRVVPAASLTLRAVEMHPTPAGGLERRDHRVAALGSSGCVALPDVVVGAVVRAAVGIEEGGQFRARVVAVEVDCDGDELNVVFAPRRHPTPDDLQRLRAL